MVFPKFEQVAKYWDRSRDLRNALDMRYVRAISPLRTTLATSRAFKVIKTYRTKYIDQADEDSSSDVDGVLAQDVRIERLHLRSVAQAKNRF